MLRYLSSILVAWGLRDYGIEPTVWDDPGDCAHEWHETVTQVEIGRGSWASAVNGRGDARDVEDDFYARRSTPLADCQRCGAWRGCLGLEPTPDLFVRHMVQVFREVRRVLHPSGTLWMNLGDSYITKPHGGWGSASFDPKYPKGRDRREGDGANRQDQSAAGLKPKDMVMMPARVALAMQQDGWLLRSQIPWLKANGMPQSVDDRPTSMIEYVYLFAKQESYFYDAQAVLVASSGNSHTRGDGVNPRLEHLDRIRPSIAIGIPRTKRSLKYDPSRIEAFRRRWWG